MSIAQMILRYFDYGRHTYHDGTDIIDVCEAECLHKLVCSGDVFYFFIDNSSIKSCANGRFSEYGVA
jgi:hypothetical protein